MSSSEQGKLTLVLHKFLGIPRVGEKHSASREGLIIALFSIYFLCSQKSPLPNALASSPPIDLPSHQHTFEWALPRNLQNSQIYCRPLPKIVTFTTRGAPHFLFGLGKAREISAFETVASPQVR
jgi:hypothetical protein